MELLCISRREEPSRDAAEKTFSNLPINPTTFLEGGCHEMPSMPRMYGQREILRTRAVLLGMAMCVLRRNF